MATDLVVSIINSVFTVFGFIPVIGGMWRKFRNYLRRADEPGTSL